MSAPTPAVVPAGHVVKLRSRGQTWTSPCLPPSVAEHHAGQLLTDVDRAGGGQGFVRFTCGDGRQVSVRAWDVYAVEHGPADQAETGRRRSTDPQLQSELRVVAGAPFRVGDPDPMPDGPPWCMKDDPTGRYVCTWRPGHGGDHVAGNGELGIEAVWPPSADKVVRP